MPETMCLVCIKSCCCMMLDAVFFLLKNLKGNGRWVVFILFARPWQENETFHWYNKYVVFRLLSLTNIGVPPFPFIKETVTMPILTSCCCSKQQQQLQAEIKHKAV